MIFFGTIKPKILVIKINFEYYLSYHYLHEVFWGEVYVDTNLASADLNRIKFRLLPNYFQTHKSLRLIQ